MFIGTDSLGSSWIKGHQTDYYTIRIWGKRNVMVWHPSVCLSIGLSHQYTHRDLLGGSVRRGQRTFRPDNKEERRTNRFVIVVLYKEK